jgi:hypothetical protein
VKEKSHCVVIFGKESQFASVGIDEMEMGVSRRGFGRYSEGTLRRLRDFALINSDHASDLMLSEAVNVF